ncbi:phytoene desaturase family protein [Gracilimonas sp. Q87]|uniref:phytoene desaturase family protein n=1 Tax=Gracilimonas sp. Q87 TaxID=3384766 RepID=UPI00398402C6
MKIAVIGAGLGGLSIANLLAAKGHEINVFEKNEKVGGKMNEVEAENFRFDTGPSLLTMPFLLEKLFKDCGSSLKDHLDLIPLDPVCKYFYKDGTVFTNYEDLEDNIEEIKSFSPEDAQIYPEFLDHAAELYNKTADAFIFNPLYSFKDLKQLDIFSFFGIDAFSTVADKVDSKFSSDYMRKFFKRFTTYNGSSPYQAPATLNVIPHVELNQGGFYIKGGLYKVAESLYNLAKSSGVEFHFNSRVQSLVIENGMAQGLELTNGEIIKADLIVANSDATETIVNLIPDESLRASKKRKVSSVEPSCSGYVLLLGLDKQYEDLVHHNIFFSENYKQEFQQIFQEKIMPEDPTIYVANTSYSDPDHAPENGSNLFILVNAPYLSSKYNWKKNKHVYGDKIISELESRGLRSLSDHIVYRSQITPFDFSEKYLSNKGSIYGTSSNNLFSAFIRPRNKSKDVDNLYLVGGSTHPGGGIPLVIQSAFNAMKLIERFQSI